MDRGSATLFGCIAMLSLLFAASPAVAAEGTDASEESTYYSKYVTATISTLNFAKPALSDETIEYDPEFEAMVEGNIVDQFGVAGIFAYGHATGKNLPEPYDLNGYRFGLQGVWYALGSFDQGMQLGLQGHRIQINVDDEVEGVSIEGLSSGWSTAGLVGYKGVISPGFTFLLQGGGGVQFHSADVSAEAQGAEAQGEGSTVGPKFVLNLNLGWTF